MFFFDISCPKIFATQDIDFSHLLYQKGHGFLQLYSEGIIALMTLTIPSNFMYADPKISSGSGPEQSGDYGRTF